MSSSYSLSSVMSAPTICLDTFHVDCWAWGLCVDGYCHQSFYVQSDGSTRTFHKLALALLIVWHVLCLAVRILNDLRLKVDEDVLRLYQLVLPHRNNDVQDN